jgi:hypothetical protein
MLKKIFYGLNGTVFPEGQSHPDIKTGAPIIAIDNNAVFDDVFREHGLLGKTYDENLRECVEEAYRKWGQFGPYGDVISISGRRKYLDVMCIDFQINYIGRFEYHKPSLAADLLPFIIDRDGKVFFVGIVRGKEPGLGKPAFIGGHQDIKGFRFETPAGALIHESKDEAAFSIMPIHHGVAQITKPMSDSVLIQIAIGGREFLASLDLLGTYATGWEEELHNLGRKRVDWTTAYTLVLDYSHTEAFDCEKIRSLFQAGDDAREIYVAQVNEDVPDLALSHHLEIYADAVKKLCGQRRLDLPSGYFKKLDRRIEELKAIKGN